MNPQPVSLPTPFQAVNSWTVDRKLVDNTEASPVTTVAFWICAAYTFLISSRMIEFIDNTGKLHLALISGLACILALLATGGLPKMLISTQGRWITLLCFWIFVGLPFSTWKGGSVADFKDTWLKSYMAFFIVGGLLFTLKQFKTMAVVLALSTVGQVVMSLRSGVEEANRLTMTYGSLGNSNDLASALLMGMPFIILVITDKKSNGLLRLALAPVPIFVLIAVLKTGSRGGLLAIGVMMMFVFFKASAPNKLLIIVGGLCMVALFAAVVPATLRSRYMTIFKTETTAATDGDAESALLSTQARKELFTNTFILTFRNPIFGVGLGQFSPQSFNLFVERGLQGLWFTCHDVFGLISGETGIPGLVFFCGLIVVTFRGSTRLGRVEPATPELEQIKRLSLAVTISLVAYVACGVFNTQAYSHQLPLLAALVAALERISRPYLSQAPASNPVRVVPAFVNRRLSRGGVSFSS